MSNFPNEQWSQISVSSCLSPYTSCRIVTWRDSNSGSSRIVDNFKRQNLSSYMAKGIVTE